MLLHSRRGGFPPNACKYLWWDATSKGDEYLLSQVQYVHLEQLSQVRSSFVSLMDSMRTGCLEQERAAAAIQAKHILIYTFVPVLLGLRCTSLTQKIAAFMHQLCLVCANLDDVKAFLDSFVSVTTDLASPLLL